MPDSSHLARTALHEWHDAHGGRLVEFAGWSMPIQYTSIIEEHLATRTAAGLFDISHMGRLLVSGTEATQFLDCLMTRRIANMKPGQIRYSLVCNEAGGILDDVLVYRLSSESNQYMLVVNASNRSKILEWFTAHNKLDAQVDDRTSTCSMIAVQGPLAVQAVDELFDCGLSSLRYYTGKNAQIEGEDCFLSRTGYTGEDGCEIVCDNSQVVPIWEQLVARVAPQGGKVCGLAARDTLRLEAGMPLYGQELSETINPLQAGLGFALNLKDREFVGRDAIVEIQNKGEYPVRVGLQLDGRRVARQGYQLFLGEDRVGEVSSGTFSPTFDKPIAMGYVKDTTTSIGTTLEVDIRGQRQLATIVPLPFYQRGN